MTVDQAYKVLGVSANSSRAEAEQAYRNKFDKLQRQTVPGQRLAVRQRALAEITELVSAWEVLKNRPWPSYSPPPPKRRQPSQSYTAPPASRQSQPRPQPVPAFIHPQSGARRRSSSASAPALPNRAVAISFLIAAVMMLAVVLLCVRTSATAKPQKSAQFRVLSAPWCQVELDGKAFGPSGQAKAFEVTEGRHTLTLRRNDNVLTNTLQLPPGQETLVWVQFEKGQIDVSQQ